MPEGTTDGALPNDQPEGNAELCLAERERQREIQSYLRAASIMPSTKITREPSGEPPQRSSDPCLLALVQLASFRLDAERAFLSLIHGETHYVAAEATRNTSLARGGGSSNEQDLFVGTMGMHKSYGICPQTMEFFCDATGQLTCDDPNIVANRHQYMIRDLDADPELRERPYVSGWPYMRSYLEVPIISPAGFVLGGFGVVDNKRRDYNETEVETLSHIAYAVASHLEYVQSKNHQNRSVKLIRGLDELLQTEASNETSKTAFGRHAWQPDIPRDSSWRSEQDSSALPLAEEPPRVGERTGSQAIDENVSTNSLGTSIFPLEVREAFARSAFLIQSSLAVDGIVFLDASSIPSPPRQQLYSFGPNPLATDDLATKDTTATKPCVLLAFSVADINVLAHATAPFTFPHTLLARLTQQFPHASIFSMDQFGVLNGPSTARRCETNSNTLRDGLTAAQKRTDLEDLFAHVSGATSIIFFPMWHSQKECWYAVGICWTCDPLSFFDARDGSLISAFSNSMMAEVVRLEALAGSKTKSDFISSFSHEIRSPLHGILATTELLADTLQTNEQHSMLAIIRSSGTTLLDILSHLLEFSKVNSRNVSRRSKYQQESHGLEAADLGELIEEVTETVWVGTVFELNPCRRDVERQHTSQARASTPSEGSEEIPVLVTLDIQRDVDWRMPLDVGAWKRIALNLVANALKYTPQGYVNVELELRDHAICLRVRDTGIGMSKEFMQHKLFTPFAQENPFSSGTGLGLAIVHQLMEDLGGRVDVQSEIGIGTTALVSVPLPLRPCSQSKTPALPLHLTLIGRSFRIIKPASVPECDQDADRLTYVQRLEAYIVRTAVTWLGMHVADDEHVDVYILDGSLQPAPDSIVPSSLTGKPILVITDPRSWHRLLNRGFEYLRMPFGPRQLANAIKTAIDSPTTARGGPDTSIKQGNILEQSHALTHQDTPPERPLVQALSRPPLREGAHSSSSMTETLATMLKDQTIRQHNILVVDDNAINVRILTKLLDELNCSYVTAFNGAQAVEAYKVSCAPEGSASSSACVKASSLTMIFMDISMPVMNGFEATHAIREYERKCGIRPVLIIALTALGDEENHRQAFSSGVNDFWIKPVKLGKLKRLLMSGDGGKA